MKKEKTILNLVKSGEFTYEEFKDLIATYPELSKKYNCASFLEGRHTKFDIITENYKVLTKDPICIINGRPIQLCIGAVDNKHNIFINLDSDGEYTITLPSPGVTIEDLMNNYKGPVHVMHVLTEVDFIE